MNHPDQSHPARTIRAFRPWRGFVNSTASYAWSTAYMAIASAREITDSTERTK